MYNGVGVIPKKCFTGYIINYFSFKDISLKDTSSEYPQNVDTNSHVQHLPFFYNVF